MNNVWHSRADELACWTWQRCVNRRDVWGGYNDEENRGKPYTRADGTTGVLGATLTRPAVAKRGKVLLRQSHVRQHYRATRPSHVIGLHSTSTGNTSRWGGIDVDWHGPDSNSPELNLRASMAWHDQFKALRFHPLLTDSNGAGGYHLRFFLREAIATYRVFDFLQELIGNHVAIGLPDPPEFFPKQAQIPPGGCGNWLRLPGRHHTREHWSQVWDGKRWLAGHGAIDFILSIEGDAVDLVPRCEPPEQRQRCEQPRPTYHVSDDRLSRRVVSYLDKCPNLSEGQGRDDVAFNVACFLVRNLHLGDADALGWLSIWDAYNRPPKGTERLREIIKNAHKYGQAPYGAGLAFDHRRQLRICVEV